VLYSSVNEVRKVNATGSEGWVEIGRVSRLHGVDGALLVQLYGDDPENLLQVEGVRLAGKRGVIPFKVLRRERAGTPRGDPALVRLWLAGLDSRSRGELWRGAALSIPETALQPLPQGEFYWRELLGLRCRRMDGEPLGVVEEIWPTDTNDVLVIRDGVRTHLIPALRRVLVRVDRAAGEIQLDWPATPPEEE